MANVLMVAEKPSLAESIAKILADGGEMRTRRSVACNVHEYDGRFFGKEAKFKVTSVMGHVFACDFPAEYQNWEAVDPLDLFKAPVVKAEANPKQHIVKHLQVEAKNADYLVLWLDCDREGENICFEVIRSTKASLNKPNDGKGKRSNIYRAKFSAITAVDIKKAMNNLGIPDENQSKAVDTRQELDLKIGCAFTRFQTRFFRGKYGNLDSSVVSFGPCQTPTLALCVKRHDEILSFVPQKYWTLNASIRLDSGTIRLNGDRGRIFEKKKASDICSSLKGNKKATITEISVDKKSLQRPSALNTVEMLKSASTGLGMSPSHTMQIAERLYIQGYISYPRTETTKYPASFDIKDLLKTLSPGSAWGGHADELYRNGFTWPEGGKDVGDHPPITPSALASEYELSGDSWRLYDYICRHFISSVAPNCKYNRTTVTVSVGSEKFSVSGKTVTSPGFTAIMEWRDPDDEYSLPPEIESMNGQSVDLLDVNVKEGETQPPSYLSESDLISSMEKLEIGTDASMAVHISNICERRYVSVTGTQRLMVPTNLGIVLIHGYQKIDPDLALPTLRSSMEKEINLIAEGKAKDVETLKEQLQIYSDKYVNLTKSIERMDELFEATFSPLAESGKVLSKCGKCRRYMHHIGLRPQRLHCRTCNETYSLPQGGNIKLFKELKCPLDNFELVLFSTGSKGKGYPVCPQCYNVPPFPEIMENMGCNTCSHKTCKQALINNYISPCPETLCNGMLVLDETSAPRWKLCCNKCMFVSSFSDSVHHVKLTVGDDGDHVNCVECAEEGSLTRLVDITFGKKAERGDLTKACINCDDDCEGLVENKVVRYMRPGRRGRGRGRGGRGRGRGKSRGRGRG